MLSYTQQNLLEMLFLCYNYTSPVNTIKEGCTIIIHATTNWLDYLPYNVRLRLAQCPTTKVDLLMLLDAKWQWAQDKGCYNGYKEDMLANILDLPNCNGLGNVTEPTMEKWSNLVK